MRSLQSWVVVLAFGCFAGGGLCGWALASCGSGEPARELAFADDLKVRYQLTPEQVRSLHIVLKNERVEEDALLRSIVSTQLPETLQRDLLKLHRRTKELIRYGVLDDKQRVLYDRETQLPSSKPATATMTGSAVGPTDR